jgi:uncharacterized protein with LGFP repeats
VPFEDYPRKYWWLILVVVPIAVALLSGLPALIEKFKEHPKEEPRMSAEDSSPASGSAAFKACGRYFMGADIRRKWQDFGGEKGQLGCPDDDERDAPQSPQGTFGRFVKFHDTDHPAYIFWHRNGSHAGRAFVVYGKIGIIYDQHGRSASWLGFPTSDEYGEAGKRRSDFEGGVIAWSEQAQDYVASR